MSDRGTSTFNPRAVLGLLVLGAVAFFAMLYFIGAGDTGRDNNNGGAHALGKGITGYAALTQLLKDIGYKVDVSRSREEGAEATLRVLTPPHGADGEEIAQAIKDRRWDGPTLVILPKAITAPVPLDLGGKAKKGWTRIIGNSSPQWVGELHNIAPPDYWDTADATDAIEVSLTQNSPSWTGLGLSGELPGPGDETAQSTQAISKGSFTPLVKGAQGSVLAGFAKDGGWYPALLEASGQPVSDAEWDSDEHDDEGWWNVIIVAEPDLMNNAGIADETRAQLAVTLVETAMEGDELPITFDVTFNGLGQSKNLLTLAFTQPFLAATICLILAMFIVAWRAFFRFGPALDEGRTISFGKARLVRNSAGFIQRTRRFHLLAAPYAAMMRDRIGAALGLYRPYDAMIDAALARRLPQEAQFSGLIADLESAHSRQDILRAARALQSIERKLAR